MTAIDSNGERKIKVIPESCRGFARWRNWDHNRCNGYHIFGMFILWNYGNQTSTTSVFQIQHFGTRFSHHWLGKFQVLWRRWHGNHWLRNRSLLLWQGERLPS